MRELAVAMDDVEGVEMPAQGVELQRVEGGRDARRDGAVPAFQGREARVITDTG